MVVIMKPEFTAEQLQTTIRAMEAGGVKVMVSKGSEVTILGAEGDASRLDQEYLSQLDGVDRVMRVTEPYKKANRKYHPDDSVIDMGGGVSIGGDKLVVIAGPCSVESESQMVGVAQAVKAAGACAMRGGAYKPRTSPYSFQGKGVEGIRLLLDAKDATGMPIVTELMSSDQLPMFEEAVDVIQIGARNMQNFELLKEVGRLRKPILLKRGLANTLKELLMSAEYIMAGGNENVILCERGIRTFETATRNTLDLASIPLLKTMTHLPIIVDPSHATGIAGLVKPMAMAATAAGADGLMIEVHNNPPAALCDGAQSLTPAAFKDVMDVVNQIRPLAYRG